MTPEQVEAAVGDAILVFEAWGLKRDLSLERSDIVRVVRMLLDGDHPPEFNTALFFKTLISSVRRGYRPAHEALCDIASLLTSDAKPLPLWLQEYLVFAAETGGPRSGRGRSRYANALRDGVIALAIHAVCQRYGLHPTRNPASTDKESGCSIVVRALKRRDVEMSEANIAIIWKRKGPAIKDMSPTVAQGTRA